MKMNPRRRRARRIAAAAAVSLVALPLFASASTGDATPRSARPDVRAEGFRMVAQDGGAQGVGQSNVEFRRPEGGHDAPPPPREGSEGGGEHKGPPPGGPEGGGHGGHDGPPPRPPHEGGGEHGGPPPGGGEGKPPEHK